MSGKDGLNEAEEEEEEEKNKTLDMFPRLQFSLIFN